MGFFDRFRSQKNTTVSSYQLIADRGSGFYSFDGNVYQSDIVRAAIRPKVKAVGKTVAKHVRQSGGDTKINPEPYMRFLLEEPNPYMTGQMMLEKLMTQLMLNNNAFAYIQRDSYGMPMALYPIVAINCETIQADTGKMYLRFTMKNGRLVTFDYDDVIHLRNDFNSNEVFGDSPAQALLPLMEIVTTTDQGLINAIKNSSVIRWLLKFNANLKPEAIKKQTEDFVNSFLNTDNSSAGAAGVDIKTDAQQVTPNDYVPNSTQMEKTLKRIYSFFNTNEKIVMSSYNENEWIAYYEAQIEPDVKQLSGEFTRKLFTRKERGFGNKIVFESSDLSYASMTTKLGLYNLVDRGIFTRNEVRDVFNMAPLEGGNEPVMRLDTAPIYSSGQANRKGVTK